MMNDYGEKTWSGRQSLQKFGTSIFAEMTRLAQVHDAINLAQGFPDFDGPDALKQAAIAAILHGNNQYARSMGMLELTRSISDHCRHFYDLEIDPMTQVMVFSGATEGIFSAIMGLIEFGEEVIIFEPFYDSYPACIEMAGGKVRCCRLNSLDFSVDFDALESLINRSTRILLLNSPHNPTGKVFTRLELDQISHLCIKHNILVITDEVYEHLTYDGILHIPMATLPGMFERTLTISSAGKTFSLTGWKVGWAFGPQNLVRAAFLAHQFITFSTTSPLQMAVAAGLQSTPDFYQDLLRMYQLRRQFLVSALESLGFHVVNPAGTYFVLADFSAFGLQDDVTFARYLTTDIGVACVPVSAFYWTRDTSTKRWVRFAFCKRLSTLEAATVRLQKLIRST